MTGDVSPSRHIGLDLGGTNLKWVILERSGTAWTTVDRGQVATDRGGPAAVVPQIAELGTIAELGSWAGAIGAAVHGAEQTEAAFAAR